MTEKQQTLTVGLRLARVFQLDQTEAALLANWVDEARDPVQELGGRIRRAIARDDGTRTIDLDLDEMAVICEVLRGRDVSAHGTLRQIKATCLGFEVARVGF
jgi:hypothetical protein